MKHFCHCCRVRRYSLSNPCFALLAPHFHWLALEMDHQNHFNFAVGFLCRCQLSKNSSQLWQMLLGPKLLQDRTLQLAGADPAKIFMGAEKCWLEDHALFRPRLQIDTRDKKRFYYSKNALFITKDENASITIEFADYLEKVNILMYYLY